MSLDLRSCTTLIAALGTGSLSGILVGTGLASYTARALPESSWVLRFQLEDRLFAKAMPPLMLGTILILVVACILARGTSRPPLIAAACLMLLILLLTIGLEVPLNRQIQTWTAGSAPPEWTSVRDRWLQIHLLRTLVGCLAFVCSLLALII